MAGVNMTEKSHLIKREELIDQKLKERAKPGQRRRWRVAVMWRMEK